MIPYNIIINEKCLHQYKPDKNHIRLDIITIYENTTLKEGLNVYKLKKHSNTLYYYLELENRNIIFHDVITENQKVDQNKANGFIKHGIYGYTVTYDYYETHEEIGLFDDDKEAAKVIFGLRKYNWDKKYFSEEYYPKINLKYKYIKKIFNKYIVIKYGSLNEIYGIYNTIEEAKIKQDQLIENDWKIKERQYTIDYLKEKTNNKEKQYTEHSLQLKNQYDIPQKLYFHEETTELKELIEKFNGYIPPKGIYYHKNQRYLINQRRYLECHVTNLTYVQQLNKTNIKKDK